jgi:hypothetical protein
MRALSIFFVSMSLFALISCGGNDPKQDDPESCVPATGEHGALLNAPTDAVVIQKVSQHPPGPLE